jgi:hypothetical protein
VSGDSVEAARLRGASTPGYVTPRLGIVDASPSRERLGRVVELLRGMEEEAGERRALPRHARGSSGRRRPFPRLPLQAGAAKGRLQPTSQAGVTIPRAAQR